MLDRPADLCPTPGVGVEDVERFACFGCPTLLACRWWSLHHDVAGACGGMTEAARHEWRAVWSRPLPTDAPVGLMPCGTNAAARRHERRGEPLDVPCAEAAALYKQHNRRSRASSERKSA